MAVRQANNLSSEFHLSLLLTGLLSVWYINYRIRPEFSTRVQRRLATRIFKYATSKGPDPIAPVISWLVRVSPSVGKFGSLPPSG